MGTLFANFVNKLILWASRTFLCIIAGKQILKILKNMDFSGKFLKKAVFGLITIQKAPRDPLGPPRMAKIIVPSYQDMKAQWKKKEIFN